MPLYIAIHYSQRMHRIRCRVAGKNVNSSNPKWELFTDERKKNLMRFFSLDSNEQSFSLAPLLFGSSENYYYALGK